MSTFNGCLASQLITAPAVQSRVAFRPVATARLNSSAPNSPPSLIRKEPVFAAPAPIIHPLLKEDMGKDSYEEAIAELQKLLRGLHCLELYMNTEGEDVYLVGDFTGNWKEPIKAIHKGGPRYEVEVRLPQGKYYYKYITNGNWRHSTSSPTERDESGNTNNVIIVGDTASVRPSIQQQKKDANIVKVIERPLTENERFMLAKAARCVAFSVCPIRLAPK